MDPATLIGLLAAFGSVFAMLTLEGSNISTILLPAPMILVFGATFAVGVASTTIPDFLGAMKAVPRAFKGKVEPAQKLIDQIVTIAERARKDGLLSLEQEAENVSDPFLKSALRNIADGMDAEELAGLLELEVETREKSDRAASKFFNSLGGYSPTIGIIGTVISLTHVLEHLSDPATLGPSIAGAFVATLWGVLSANLIWLPLGGRLGKLTDLTAERMNLLMEGVLAVQAGGQPRVVGEKLRAMVPAADLKGGKGKGSKDDLKEAA